MSIDAQSTEQRPYRGMQTFSEEHKNLFFGRAIPVNEIFDLLRNNLLTVIFGKSGIGKSSLLNAGLLPKLRENFYLPVLIRIPFSDPAVDPLAYTRSAIETEMRKYVFKDFKYPENTTLWQFFREANYTGGAVIPVLIFDQFEEYFNFGKQDKQQAENFIKELSDLIENRMPWQLKNAEAYKTLSVSDTQNNIRVIISLREDFLAPLEDLSRMIPSLNKTRYRILQLRGREAFDAVYLPAKNFIDADTAIHLLEKLIPKKIKAEFEKAKVDALNDNEWEQIDFEPYILSLFCYQVNEKRIAGKQDKISKELINQTKVESILNDYYNSSIKKYWLRYRKNIGHVLEKYLISEEGYRLLKPVNSNEFKSISQPAINDLVNDRIIQIVNRNDISNIEISHDLLAKVIYQKKLESSRNKKLAVFISAGAVLFLILSAVLWRQTQRSSDLAAEVSVVKDSLVKTDSVAKANFAIKDSLATKVERIEKRYNGIVYFQVNDAAERKRGLASCMEELRGKKFWVPSAEIIKKQFRSMVKYYHEEDKAIAEDIVSVCNKYYAPPPLSARLITSKSNKVSPGTIEVWVYTDSTTDINYY